jgi:hypothetical protein
MKSFKFSIAKCVLCKKKSLIENTAKICLSCAGKIKDAFSKHHFEEKQREVLGRGRNKWYFTLEKNPHSFETRYLLMFVPILYWKENEEIPEPHLLSEEEQEYINYLPVKMGMIDEVSFELEESSPAKARKTLKELGLKELKV